MSRFSKNRNSVPFLKASLIRKSSRWNSGKHRTNFLSNNYSVYFFFVNQQLRISIEDFNRQLRDGEDHFQLVISICRKYSFEYFDFFFSNDDNWNVKETWEYFVCLLKIYKNKFQFEKQRNTDVENDLNTTRRRLAELERDLNRVNRIFQFDLKEFLLF